MPSRRSLALIAGCALAAISAASAWAATADAPAAHAATVPTWQHALRAAPAARHDLTKSAPDQTTTSAVRGARTDAGRSFARSPLQANNLTHQSSAPATQALSASLVAPLATRPTSTTLPDSTRSPELPTLQAQAATVRLTLQQQAAALLARQRAAAAAAQAAAKAKAAAAAAKAEAERLAILHRWVRPNYGSLSSPYGPRWGGFHPGIDLAGRYGSPILAATSGTVLYAGPESGYGEILKIQDWDGTQTWYGHMSKFLVKAGEKVTPGEEVALVGAAGNATGPHLHFEVHVNGNTVDPIPFLAARGIHI
jgi:murein DD-endopeptidase MepM/ murein hydrolase activator NlpD